MNSLVLKRKWSVFHFSLFATINLLLFLWCKSQDFETVFLLVEPILLFVYFAFSKKTYAFYYDEKKLIIDIKFINILYRNYTFIRNKSNSIEFLEEDLDEDFEDLLGYIFCQIFRFKSRQNLSYLIIATDGKEKFRLCMDDFSKAHQMDIRNFFKDFLT